MLKTVGWIVAGLLAGLAIAWVLPGGDAASGGRPETAGDFLPSAAEAAIPDERFAGLQEALRAEGQARLLLEERIEELSAELAALREERSARPAPAIGQSLRDVLVGDMRGSEQRDAAGAPTESRGALSAEERVARETEREIERIVAAGFSRDRAEQIHRLGDELNFQLLQAQYEARRAGRPVDTLPTRDQLLRRELGDAEYEQLLRGTGRLMEVSVASVFAGSPAERAGLKPGDRILSYAGTRIFEIGEINPLTTQGTPGETIVVEVLRDGRPMQLALPRGPMGINLSGTRAGGRAGPGPLEGGVR